MTFSEFLDNQSTKRYYEIIEMAILFPPYGYTEKHHIIPASFYKNNKRSKTGWLDGNPNDPTNLVILTGKEHFICHQLLTHMLPVGTSYYKMSHAFFNMFRKSKSNNSLYIPTPEEYEEAKILNSNATSKLLLGRKHSDEARANMSKAALERKPPTQETKNKISKAMLGKTPSPKVISNVSKSFTCKKRKLFSAEAKANMSKPKSAETRAKMSKASKGKPKSDEHRANMSKAHKGRKLSDETKLKMSKPKSAETRAKMSKASKGKPKSDEHRANMSKAHKGRKLSDNVE